MGPGQAWTVSDSIKIGLCFICLVYNTLYLLSPCKSAPIRRAQYWNESSLIFGIPYLFFRHLPNIANWRASILLFSPFTISIVFSGLETIHSFAFAHFLSVSDKLTRPSYLYPTYMGMGVCYSIANIITVSVAAALDSYFCLELIMVIGLLVLLGPGILSIWHLTKIFQVLKKRILSKRNRSSVGSSHNKTSPLPMSKKIECSRPLDTCANNLFTSRDTRPLKISASNSFLRNTRPLKISASNSFLRTKIQSLNGEEKSISKAPERSLRVSPQTSAQSTPNIIIQHSFTITSTNKKEIDVEAEDEGSLTKDKSIKQRDQPFETNSSIERDPKIESPSSPDTLLESKKERNPIENNSKHSDDISNALSSDSKRRRTDSVRKGVDSFKSRRKEKSTTEFSSVKLNHNNQGSNDSMIWSLRQAILIEGTVCIVSILLIGYSSGTSSWQTDKKLSDNWRETQRRYNVADDFGVWAIILIVLYLAFHNKVPIHPNFKICYD
ncbi:hypothetical protein AAMO2058_001733900 [Amorphochlora amoebiformis]